MAVPARRKSKAKKNMGRAHKKLTAPAISFDIKTGQYKRSHYISSDGYYKGRKVITKGEK